MAGKKLRKQFVGAEALTLPRCHDNTADFLSFFGQFREKLIEKPLIFCIAAVAVLLVFQQKCFCLRCQTAAATAFAGGLLSIKPVIAVDTHVFRVSRRIGLSDGSTVEAVEKDLTSGFPAELRGKAHHWLILHGRYVCKARKPDCNSCGIKEFCREYTLNNVKI